LNDYKEDYHKLIGLAFAFLSFKIRLDGNEEEIKEKWQSKIGEEIKIWKNGKEVTFVDFKNSK